MTVILGIRSSHVAAAGSDSQRVSSKGESEASYDKTFETKFLVGAHAGLLKFAGLDVKVHIVNALDDHRLSPRDAVRAIATHLRPILESIDESEVGFKYRTLDIIVASRSHVASVRLLPDLALHQIEAQFNENHCWLVAGDDQAKAEAIRMLSRRDRYDSFGREKLRTVTHQAIESAIAAGGPHPHHPNVPSCCKPVRLRHIR